MTLSKKSSARTWKILEVKPFIQALLICSLSFSCSSENAYLNLYEGLPYTETNGRPRKDHNRNEAAVIIGKIKDYIQVF